jgi:hypothetical protein
MVPCRNVFRCISVYKTIENNYKKIWLMISIMTVYSDVFLLLDKKGSAEPLAFDHT